MIKKTIKRYALFICLLAAVVVITVFNKNIGTEIFKTAGSSFKQMLSVLPPVMIMLCLMDEWVPRETMMKYMGKGSGPLGITLAIIIGSLAAGPMYAAFPFTAVMLRKGVRFSNIIIFMSAWCVTKISTVLFELAALGYKFTLVRLCVDLPGIIIMGYIVEWLLPKSELDKIYINSEKIDE